MTGAATATEDPTPRAFEEFRVPSDLACQFHAAWAQELLATTPAGTWAPLAWSPSDEQLALLNLPPREYLRTHRFPEPTLVDATGATHVIPVEDLERALAQPAVGGPALAAYAGSGCLGIRPGAWLLLLTGGIGWCSLAHVYGSPGSYAVSTAGHCGAVGDVATVIAAVGNHNGLLQPVLLDFGRFSKSVENGPGRDWALINVDPAFQGLVSPTLCLWGGPRGMFTSVGSLVGVHFAGNSFVPTVSVTPDPSLAQGVVHYGHGLGVGTGGTPRVGLDIAWSSDTFTFTGAISFGDSGSGGNTVGGDAPGDTMEAAGIITHLYVDPLLREGVGLMLGTRATQVAASLANGQLVPYPAPAPALP